MNGYPNCLLTTLLKGTVQFSVKFQGSELWPERSIASRFFTAPITFSRQKCTQKRLFSNNLLYWFVYITISQSGHIVNPLTNQFCSIFFLAYPAATNDRILFFAVMISEDIWKPPIHSQLHREILRINISHQIKKSTLITVQMLSFFQTCRKNVMETRMFRVGKNGKGCWKTMNDGLKSRKVEKVEKLLLSRSWC